MSENRRYEELKVMLQERKRELNLEVRKAIRERGQKSARRQDGDIPIELIERSNLDIQEDIELAFIEIKSSTLVKVNEALERLEQGNYGNCGECGKEIAEKRLRALPFAVRCKDCEEAREIAEQRKRELALRRGSAARMLFNFDDERA